MTRDRRKAILMLAGGGIAHTSGGVGTLIRYLIDCWSMNPSAPPVRVVDTRGDGSNFSGIVHFVRALAGLIWDCGHARLAVVHAHMTTRGSVLRKCMLCLMANMFGVPTIVHQHGADFHDYFRKQSAPLRWLIRGTLNRASYVVVLGKSWADFLVQEVGVREETIVIIANGVPNPQWEPVAPAVEAQEANILFLGRLGDRKGVPELIAALGTPRLRARSWHAHLAGDGEVERFRDVIRKAGLCARVTVNGWQDRAATASLLRQADIMVLPSHHEAMPVAVLEGLAHRVAVVTTPVGVIPEILRDGHDVVLTPPGDVQRLADALEDLVDHPDRRRSIGLAGYHTFRSRLEIGAVAEALMALYRAAGISSVRRHNNVELSQEASR